MIRQETTFLLLFSFGLIYMVADLHQFQQVQLCKCSPLKIRKGTNLAFCSNNLTLVKLKKMFFSLSLFSGDGLQLIWLFTPEINTFFPLSLFIPSLKSRFLHSLTLQFKCAHSLTFVSFSFPSVCHHFSLSSSHFPVHWLKYGETNQAMTWLLFLSTDFFNTLSLVLSIITFPLLFPYSLFPLVSRSCDFLRQIFFPFCISWWRTSHLIFPNLYPVFSFHSVVSPLDADKSHIFLFH